MGRPPAAAPGCPADRRPLPARRAGDRAAVLLRRHRARSQRLHGGLPGRPGPRQRTASAPPDRARVCRVDGAHGRGRPLRPARPARLARAAPGGCRAGPAGRRSGGAGRPAPGRAGLAAALPGPVARAAVRLVGRAARGGADRADHHPDHRAGRRSRAGPGRRLRPRRAAHPRAGAHPPAAGASAAPGPRRPGDRGRGRGRAAGPDAGRPAAGPGRPRLAAARRLRRGAPAAARRPRHAHRARRQSRGARSLHALRHR